MIETPFSSSRVWKNKSPEGIADSKVAEANKQKIRKEYATKRISPESQGKYSLYTEQVREYPKVKVSDFNNFRKQVDYLQQQGKQVPKSWLDFIHKHETSKTQSTPVNNQNIDVQYRVIDKYEAKPVESKHVGYQIVDKVQNSGLQDISKIQNTSDISQPKAKALNKKLELSTQINTDIQKSKKSGFGIVNFFKNLVGYDDGSNDGYYKH
ncbi:MAG: hypothetical protein AAGF07_02805 [Patescibacteria group bacterium]